MSRSVFTTCRVCGQSTGFTDRRVTTCGSCCGKPAPQPAPEPAQPVVQATEETRQRWHEQRVAHVRDAFDRGRRALLARALDPENSSWALIQH